MPEYLTEEKFSAFLVEETRHHAINEEEMKHIGERLSGVEEQVENLHHTIYGNGVIGMDETIRKMWDILQKQDAKSRDKKAELRKYVFWGITFLISQGTGILVAIFLVPHH